MEANGVNYFKGVLLCSRPNQSPAVTNNKVFYARVTPHQQIGLVPTKQYGQRKVTKRSLPVLSNHKKWLEQFKKQLQQKKSKEQQEQQKKQQYLEKLRQQGRQKIKEVSTKTTQTILNNNSETASKQNNSPQKNKQSVSKKDQKVSANPHKKKSKPAWAQTQQQAQEHEQHEVDQLLDFFQKGDTQEVKDYMNDQSVKKVLEELKNKIQTLKKQGNQWKNNQMIKIQDQRRNQQQQDNNRDGKDDILSRISKQSGGQSVASQKTVQRVQQLQKKKQTKQWDNISTSKKTSIASVDEQIAKHIADQILRNYPNLKHHSNQSIRKLLQKQAKEELKGSS